MSRDARANIAGLSNSDKPFSVAAIKANAFENRKRCAIENKERKRENLVEARLDDPDAAIVRRPPLPPLFGWLNVIL